MYNHVIWPQQYDPKTSALYALNDIDVNAPPDVVWKLLVDAENWSSYFPAEDQVKILTGEPELALGTGSAQNVGGWGCGRYDWPIDCWLGDCGWRGSCAWLKRGSIARHGLSTCWISGRAVISAISRTWG